MPAGFGTKSWHEVSRLSGPTTALSTLAQVLTQSTHHRQLAIMSSANMSQKRLHILEDEMLSALRLYISARTHDTFAVYLAGLEVRKPLKMEYKGLSEIVSESQ